MVPLRCWSRTISKPSCEVFFKIASSVGTIRNLILAARRASQWILTTWHVLESSMITVVKLHCILIKFWSPPSIPNLPNRWRQNMNSVWTDHYQRPLLTVCLYPRGAEGWEKLQQHPLITNLPLWVKFGTKLMGIRIQKSLTKWVNKISHKDISN